MQLKSILLYVLCYILYTESEIFARKLIQSQKSKEVQKKTEMWLAHLRYCGLVKHKLFVHPLKK